MRVVSLDIPDVKLLTPRIVWDDRGFFSETYRRTVLAETGVEAEFVQENHSLSVEPGTVRGLHFQVPPHAQGKLIRVTRGRIFDVAVDIRVGSPTYGQHVTSELSAANWTQVWMPPGFAHGFCAIEPNTEVVYKVTDYYAQVCERGLRWDDPALGIAWPVAADRARLSDRDRRYPGMSELPAYFQVRR